MPTITVKDAGGSAVAIEKPPAPGRAAASLSKPVALSTEDKAALDATSAAANRTPLTPTASYTRPNDVVPYIAGDALGTAPGTVLSFTLASAAGKGGVITDMIVASSAASNLRGELWLFDAPPTPVADNDQFGVSDSENRTLVAIIPFSLSPTGSNSQVHVQNLCIGFTTVAQPMLYGLVRVTSPYTPEANEVITFRPKAGPVG